MGCGEKCAKIFLFVVNVLVWIVGAAFLGIGIWVAVSPSTFVKEALAMLNMFSITDQQILKIVEQLLSSSMLMVGAYIMIAVGAFLFLVGFCGCCGACRESKCMLMVYIVFCVISFVLTLAIGIIDAVYMNEISSLMTHGFKEVQRTNFDGMYNSSDALSVVWYLVMQDKKCCGIYGKTDFSVNASSMATKWSNSRFTCSSNHYCFVNATYPASCCANSTSASSSAQLNQCVNNSIGIYSANCQSEFITPFSNYLQQYAIIMVAVSFSLSLFCLLAIAAAVAVMRD